MYLKIVAVVDAQLLFDSQFVPVDISIFVKMERIEYRAVIKLLHLKGKLKLSWTLFTRILPHRLIYCLSNALNHDTIFDSFHFYKNIDWHK